MITLFGATGYTGQKIAVVLARSGQPFRIAGRSARRLEVLADNLNMPQPPAILVADVAHPETLIPLLHGTRVLINCAGPYTDLGERVLAQAAMRGVGYLDVTNELGYRFKVRSYHELARSSKAALVPACGFEVALADCAAALAARPLFAQDAALPLDSLEVVYALHGQGASAGTRRSAIRSLATSWISYRDGRWQGAVPGGQVRRFSVPTRSGGMQAIHALSFPSCESVTVPAHLPVQAVSTWMSTTPTARYWAPVLVPLFARLARSILGPLAVRLAGGGGLKNLDDQRSGDQFTIMVTARRGDQTSSLTVSGTDVYGITAEIINYYAQAMLQPGFDRAGLLAPAEVVDPAAFLEKAAADWGVTILPGSLTAHA
jgi:short subunit dehydrogenase-like uncharacterized protein